ncbi:hypothetical protein BDW72DRAFT_165427 [Aspergillus terricola var. indicus]
MDQEIPQTDDLFNFVGPDFGYNETDHGLLEAWAIPRIMGPGPDPTSSVGLPNGYPEPQSNSYYQNEPSQTYLDPNSGQNWLTGAHTHASPVSMGHNPEAPLTPRSSSRPLTGEPQLTTSPYSPADPSPLNGQDVTIGSHRPALSPTIPPATNAVSFRDLLSMLIQTINAILFTLTGRQTPDNSQLRTVQEQLQDALSIVNELTSPHQGREQNGNDEDKQFRCLLCPQRLTCKNRGTFKRHITTTHYPSKRYFCPICDQGSSSAGFLRKDKHLLHMRQHGQPRMSKEEMEAVTQHLPPPQNCAIAGCRQPISTWEDFINCLCRHCAIADDWDQDNGSDGDDGDDDDNNGDDGNGGSNRFFSQPGNRNYGNMSNGAPYSHYSDNQYGNYNGRNGTNPHQYRGVANSTSSSSKQQSSQVLGLKGVPTGPGRAGISQPKPTFASLKDSQPHTKNPTAVYFDTDNLCPETFRVEVSLRFASSIWKSRDELGMKEPQEKPGSEKQAVSISVSKEVSRELQRLRYFETCVYENQKQGSLLTYVYETFVVSQHGHFEQVIESSMHSTYMRRRLKTTYPFDTFADLASNPEILYQTVEFGVARQPKIPADCLFYLAKEKDHGSSEANLEATRRASPRKRAHLRVRVKAIAGVLALRAAVTKAPLATDNTEVGDGWELGIPYPAQDDVFKVLAWLVQALVFFLRMPPNPRVHVVLACGSLEAP